MNRRDLLKTAAVAPAALVVPLPAGEEPLPWDKDGRLREGRNWWWVREVERYDPKDPGFTRPDSPRPQPIGEPTTTINYWAWSGVKEDHAAFFMLAVNDHAHAERIIRRYRVAGIAGHPDVVQYEPNDSIYDWQPHEHVTEDCA